jgi:DNA mismatch repair ATPase MutS
VHDLGHPLIASDTRVMNNFHLDELGTAVIITGSNMAGKSSFLRAVGVNLQLAYCGSVVCAADMTVGMFRTFTSIRVSDSVVDGFSYFYAEVRRLKSLLMALKADDSIPLFYLIDEIFRGTNNRERLIGSRAYLQALVGANGVGLIATHDLELVKLEDELRPVQNYHFREDVINGKMRFDYRLRPGPSPTTNALKIMALAGLPVDAHFVGAKSVDAQSANEPSDGSGKP